MFEFITLLFILVKETARILKVLTDPKAPLIKKRQVMRTNFGDYRKKMAEEEKTAKPGKYSHKSSNGIHGDMSYT